jgi:acyl-coenzyme A synthetase/AMP-(fatty) acid ligase
VQSVTSAGTLVLTRDFSPAATRRALLEQEVVYLSCTPSFARQLLFALEPADWAAMKLRHITMGGEIVDQELLDGLRALVPDTRITHTYGASEVGALIWVQDYRAGFSAELLDGERFKEVDGELVVRRSPRAGLGYVGAAPRTGEWLTTGDLVEVRGDRVHFVGRKDDVINVAGFKVNPAAVAAVVRELPAVLDVSVVAQSSSVVGNLVKAVVYTRPGTDHGELRTSIVKVCRDRFPPPMVPRLFEFTEGLRLSGAQKLRRGSA